MNTTIIFQVPEMSTGHCEAAISEEVTLLDGVAIVETDLDTQQVRVHGEGLDDHAIIVAIDAVGYEAVRI